MFKRYPYSDIYSGRPALAASVHASSYSKIPGYITIHGDEDKHQRKVINMVAQYYPGSPIYPDSIKDGKIQRERYFYRCLREIARIPKLHSVGFPYFVGCGLAGGNWDNYFAMLKAFDQAASTQGTTTTLYRV
jgi:hypothetical protein